jgi:biopolymer transport protein ExbD
MAASSNDDDEGLISAINVTPLVDVVLVLLIIFMVTARIIHSQGVPMELPKASTGENIQNVFSVELTQEGKTFVDSTQLDGDDGIAGLAKSAKAKNPELRATIRADRKVEHGRVIHVLDLLKRAGVNKIAFAAVPGGDAQSPAKASPAKASPPVSGTP